MLGRKLILIAAAVALAVTNVADAKSHHTAAKTHHASGKVVVHKHHEPQVKVVFKDAEPAKNETQGEEKDGSDDDDDDDDDADVEEVVVELCLPGWTEVSVEGVEGVYCAKGQICVADKKDGTCPEAQQGLPYGAYCDTVKTGVYGCKPKTKDMVEEKGETPKCTGEGESPMSVEGVEGVFCVKGQACVADIKDGACPGPQEGLPNGAVCGKVKTGVYGCKPAGDEEAPADDDDDHDHDDDDDDDDDDHEGVEGNCGEGESPMSVEGVEGIFCVKGQSCVADIKDGACPGPQEGLEYGAYCGTVKTGVYGCKPKSKDQHDHEHAPEEEPADKPESNPALCSGKDESPMSVEGVEGIFCVTGQACVADIADGACPGPQEGLPNGAVCGKVKTGVYGCKPAGDEEAPADDDDDDDSSDDSDDGKCGEGESPMSVEGVEGIFCVKGQACVADIKDGACPGPQEGLPNGAVCGKVKTGVYGCKPADAEEKPADDDDSEEESEESDDGKCGEGESPMSVEGVEGIFCVKGQACVADIKDGACPGPQEGLPKGAVCGKVKTGVYGCKPAEEGDDDDSSDDGTCGEGESPMSVEGVEGIFCVKGQACVADIKDGACPGPQEGLPNGAECGVVKSGVYGCKPKAAKHRKSVTKKGHSIKVVKAHAKKVSHKKH